MSKLKEYREKALEPVTWVNDRDDEFQDRKNRLEAYRTAYIYFREASFDLLNRLEIAEKALDKIYFESGSQAEAEHIVVEALEKIRS